MRTHLKIATHATATARTAKPLGPAHTSWVDATHLVVEEVLLDLRESQRCGSSLRREYSSVPCRSPLGQPHSGQAGDSASA